MASRASFSYLLMLPTGWMVSTPDRGAARAARVGGAARTSSAQGCGVGRVSRRPGPGPRRRSQQRDAPGCGAAAGLPVAEGEGPSRARAPSVESLTRDAKNGRSGSTLLST
jgi:hypothetical protein